MEPRMEEQKCPRSPFAVLSSPQQCPLPNLALLVYICRLIKPKPSSTMFPKHSLITINQQAGGAAACPVSILLMTEEDCQTASSALGGETWVLLRLRRQRRCWEPPGTERRPLVLDKEKWAGPLSEKNNVKSPSTYPLLSSYQMNLETKNRVKGKLKVKESQLATPTLETYAFPGSQTLGLAGGSRSSSSRKNLG